MKFLLHHFRLNGGGKNIINSHGRYRKEHNRRQGLRHGCRNVRDCDTDILRPVRQVSLWNFILALLPT